MSMGSNQWLIRSEKVSDIEAIDNLLKAAFETEAEAHLVKNLRDHGALLFSLLVLDKGTEEIAAYLALSPVTIESSEGKARQALGLAPVAVSPRFQSQGLGSLIVRHWFEEYAEDFFQAVVVLGEPEYYQRFGFENAAQYNIFWSGNSDKKLELLDYFMIKELKKGFLKKVEGFAFYHPAFDEV